MTNYIRVRNWEKFQHYKDRRPTWIKAYTSLLNDYEFSRLADHQKAHVLGIWLLAAQMENRIPADAGWIAARIHATKPVDLQMLNSLRFIEYTEPQDVRTETLAEPEQAAILDKDKYTDIQREEKETTMPLGARYLGAFNVVFDRKLSLTPQIENRASTRKREGYHEWQLVALPVLVEAQGVPTDVRKALLPETLLRDGKHARTLNGRTTGATDWLERALQRLDRTVLTPRLAGIAESLGVLPQLRAAAVQVQQ